VEAPENDMALPPGATNNVSTASASHANELGLPVVPNTVKSGYLQDAPAL
jgi:hypothetical protein